jgi:hypothetical protein
MLKFPRHPFFHPSNITPFLHTTKITLFNSLSLAQSNRVVGTGSLGFAW